jgi:hypothetical protein
MTVKRNALQVRAEGVTLGISFDWLFTIAAMWLIGGLFLDGWAHNHDKVDTSFFTPWHAVFYSGFAAVALVLFMRILQDFRRGSSFRQAIPVGYELSLIGVFIFAFGGLFDLGWHTLFGIEKGIEALFSPSHLTLGLGMLLIVTGPLRAAWATHNNEKPTLLGFLPVLGSILLFLSVLTFFTQSSNPLVNTFTIEGRFRPAESGLYTVTSTSAMLLQTALMMTVILLVMRRWTLPFGSLALLFLINSLLMCTQGDQYRLVPGALLAGLIGDIMIQALHVSPELPIRLRIFSFVLPVAFWSLYLFGLAITSGIWWTTHVWAGIVLETGGLGLLMSYLIVQPQVAEKSST